MAEGNGSAKLIEPALPSGFQDFAPARMLSRNRMLAIIGRVYEQFGFVPLQTSEVEYLETLTGGDPSFAKDIYNVARRDRQGKLRDDDERQMALRFDLTVSLARFVAANPDLPIPFKRWQVGNVWRGEKAQRGRYRQFAQCDADIVGSASVLADAEIIMVMHTVMRELGIERFVIRFNDRKILNGLLELCGIVGAKVPAALRAMDKLEGAGPDEVRTMLQRQPDNEFDETGLALSDEVADRIMAFLALGSQEDSLAMLAEVQALLAESALAMEGVSELREICGYLVAAHVPAGQWRVDLSIARGLGYYTGPVFETTLLDAADFGSVYSGGRFDGLVSRFSTRSLPATGASIGVDRLLAALEHLGTLPQQPNWTDVFIVRMDDALLPDYFSMAAELRAAGFRVELNLGKEQALRSQLGLAQTRGLPVVLIYGSSEAERNVVQLKKLVPSGAPGSKLLEVPRERLVQAVQNFGA